MEGLKKAFSYSNEHKKKTFLAFFLILLSGISGIVPFLLTYDLILKFIENVSIELDYLLLISGGIILSLFLKGLFLYQGLDASHQVAYDTLVEKMRKMPLGEINKKGLGSYKKNLVEDIDSIEILLAHAVPEGIPALIVPLLVFIVIFLTDWRLGLLSLGSIPFGLIAMAVMMKIGTKKMPAYFRAREDMNKTIVEYINGMDVIKIFGRTTDSYDRYKDSVEGNRDFTLDWFKESWTYMALYSAILPCTVLLLLPFGLNMYLNGSVELGQLILSIMLAMSVGGPLTRVIEFVPAIIQLGYKIDELEKTFQGSGLKEGKEKLVIKNHDIEFENVTFAYEEEEVIKDISFTLQQNTLTAIVGESGSGKSTLAKLLVHFWDIKKGKIKIDGKNINKFSVSDLMEEISYVSQDTFLFDQSVLENIRIGRVDASDEEVYEAAKLAQAHDFILEMEDGYASKAGDSGDKLSGGQKQRITIARAILRDSPIVIMDEATAFTDPENEDKIQEALSKLIAGKTVLVIAHRLSTIVDADNILVIENGRLTGQGKHESLLEKNNKYKELWNSHLKSMDWSIEVKE
ncbi:MAG: ABC transporter ATP-binding protein [Senegalia sp. (in: firmicutes)]